MISKPIVSDQQSAVSSQLQHRNIEELKGRKDPEALQAAAKELEALFAYEMIKAMRATTETDKGGFGKDTYMSLFDTELSRIFADRGLGLKEHLLKGLNRQAAKGTQQSAVSAQPTVISPQRSAISGQEKKAEILTPNPPSPIPVSVEPNIPVDGVISSKFGMRKHPLHGDGRFHQGMDIAAPAGTEVYPYQGGKVVFSGEQSGYGNTIVIDHGNGYTTKYAHNRVNLVKTGDLVDEDTVLAEVGSTGLSTGPHLHFEVRKNGKSLDPATVLALK
ncbi:MAG: peptidoglycan DD-metalloendopeptidase family protein [Nitrospirae bacterium]|nr:peptidoglycan DD-metalloendopeptidase family protein [Nitrospirota bacterium]